MSGEREPNRPPFLVRFAVGALAKSYEDFRSWTGQVQEDISRLPDEIKKIPVNLASLPVQAVTNAVSSALRLQQNFNSLVIKGDETLDLIFHKPEEKPSWATFYEDEDEEILPPSLPDVKRVAPVTPITQPRSAAKPAAPEPAAAPKRATPTSRTNAKPATSKPTAPKPAVAKPKTEKPTAFKPPAPPKPAAAKSAAPKPAASKPAAAKSAAPKPAASKPAVKKPAAPKAPAAKPATPKPAAAKAPAAKPATPKPAAAKSAAPKPAAAPKAPTAPKLSEPKSEAPKPAPTSQGNRPELVEYLEYETLSLAQLRARARNLSVPELREILSFERGNGNRPPFITLLENRMTTSGA